MDILQFVYYIEKMIMLGISSIVSLIKKQPEKFVADVVIGGVLLYLAILIIRCILHAISFRYPILNRKCRKIISFFKLPLGKMNVPIQIGINVIQTISIVVAIIFSDNVLNIVRLENKNTELKNTETTLTEKNKLLEELDEEIKVKQKMIDNLQKRNIRLESKSKDAVKKIEELQDSIDTSTLKICTANIRFSIYLYIITPFSYISETLVKTGRTMPDTEIIQILKKSFSITKSEMLIAIIDELYNNTIYDKERELYLKIKTKISDFPELNTPIIDIDSFYHDLSVALKKESFFLWTDKNFIKLQKIQSDIAKKHIANEIDIISASIAGIEMSIFLE